MLVEPPSGPNRPEGHSICERNKQPHKFHIVLSDYNYAHAHAHAHAHIQDSSRRVIHKRLWGEIGAPSPTPPHPPHHPLELGPLQESTACPASHNTPYHDSLQAIRPRRAPLLPRSLVRAVDAAARRVVAVANSKRRRGPAGAVPRRRQCRVRRPATRPRLTGPRARRTVEARAAWAVAPRVTNTIRTPEPPAGTRARHATDAVAARLTRQRAVASGVAIADGVLAWHG